MKPFSVLSDFHFEHTKILTMERGCFDTIEEHDEKVLATFKKALQANIFYFLGDFGLVSGDMFYKIKKMTDKYPCKKIMIRGNHDTQLLRQSLVEYKVFDEIHDYPLWVSKRICLSHHPVAVYGNSLNIHGHLHGSVMGDENHINANVHMLGYEPLFSKDIVMPKSNETYKDFIKK